MGLVQSAVAEEDNLQVKTAVVDIVVLPYA